jgi:hypothetical protein
MNTTENSKCSTRENERAMLEESVSSDIYAEKV